MQIIEITDHKKQFLNLLLLGDEQEDMIDRYLERGKMFALYDGDLKTVCVVTREEGDSCELKNIATYEAYQGYGYGRRMMEYVFDYYKDTCKTMFIGTGDNPSILAFYKRRGFVESHRVKNFFTDHYDHPIFEAGVQLVDMVYLKKDF